MDKQRIDGTPKVTQPESDAKLVDDVPIVEDEGFSSQAKTVSKDMAGYLDQQEQDMLFQVRDLDHAQEVRAMTVDMKSKNVMLHANAQEQIMRNTYHNKAPEVLEELAQKSGHQSFVQPSEAGYGSHQPQSFKRDKSRRSTFKEGTMKQVAEDDTKKSIVVMDAQTNNVALEATPMESALKLNIDYNLNLETNSQQKLSEQLGQIPSSGGREISARERGTTPSSQARDHNLEENALLGRDQADALRYTAQGNELDQNKYTTMYTIFNYVRSDIKKKQRSFKIGVFTIFLVVTFIVMLKSVVDKIGVAFLKVAQDQAGIFDVTMTAGADGYSVAGDIDLYNSDPFDYQSQESKNGPNLLDMIGENLIKDNGDYTEVLGFKLLNFGKLKEKLDPLTEYTDFRAFSPRWILPTKFRNVTNPARNTSSILIVLDSAREVDRKLAEYFSQEIIGMNEVMITEQALLHLDVNKTRKEQIEMFIDIGAMIDMFAPMSGGGGDAKSGGSSGSSGLNSTSIDQAVNQQLNDQVGQLFEQLLPSTKEIANILRQNNFNVTDDDMLVVDVNQLIKDNVNLSAIDISIPSPVNLTELLPPGTDLSFLDDINITLPNDTLLGPLPFSAGEILKGEVKVSLDVLSAVLESLGPTEIEVPIDSALEGIVDRFFNFTDVNITLALKQRYTVIDGFEDSYGKFGNTLGNVALVDCHYFGGVLSSSYEEIKNELAKISPLMALILLEMDPQVRAAIESMNFCDYSMTVNGMVNDQIAMYTGTKQNMNLMIGNSSNQIIDKIGQDSNVTITFPIKQQMNAVEFITIFMSSNMLAIIAFLAILSTQLIYSLMLSDVEEKTYEFGMLRALGFNTNNVGVTIVVQAISFAMPGLAVGFIMAFILNVVVRHILYDITKNYDTYMLSSGSVIIGVVIGTFIPLLSNIIPIQKALGKNLRASLDLYHRKAGELTVAIQKLKDYGLSMEQFVLAIMLVVLGILTYYVAPVSFLFQKIELFFLILNGLLLIMILGLTFLSMLLQPKFEALLLKLSMCCCKRDRNLKAIISKNMESHSGRNLKTAIMFGICLSFLIFAGGTFKLLGELIVSQLEISVGSDLYGVVVNPRSLPSFIDQGQITQFLLEQQQEDGAVVDFTFASPSLKELLNKISVDSSKASTYFSDATGYKTVRANFYAVEKNFLDATNQKYYMPTEISEDYFKVKEDNDEPVAYVSQGRVNAIDALYTNYSNENAWNNSDPFNLTNRPENTNQTFNQINIIVPEGYRDACSLDTEKTARMCVGYRCQAIYQAKIVGMLKKMPGWYFTAYQNAQFFSQQLISEKQYRQLLEDYMNQNPETRPKYNDLLAQYNFTNGVPKYKIFVKLDPSISEERRDFIANGIRSYFKDDQTVLLDLQFAMKSVTSSLQLFQIFVGVVGAIALCLAFFLLMVSTTQNIKENIWEYGCLRAIGLNKTQGLRVFMYEQYIVIVCSLVLGTIVGLILAAICTAQFFLFLEFPFKLEFPAELLYAMFALALLTTFFAVYIPVKRVNKEKISTTIKGISNN